MEHYLTGNMHECIQYLDLIAEVEKIDLNAITDADTFKTKVYNMLGIKLVNFRTLVAENLTEIDIREPLYASLLRKIREDDEILISTQDTRTSMGLLQEEVNLVLETYMHRGSLPKEARFEAMVLAYTGLIHRYLNWPLVMEGEQLEQLEKELFAELEKDDETSIGMDPRVGAVTVMAVWMYNYNQFQEMVWQEKDAARQTGTKPDQNNQAAPAEKPLSEEEAAQQEARRENERREHYRQEGLCQHCGGHFKGIFKKVCASCGKPKDY